MADHETKLVIKGEDKTAAAFKSAADNAKKAAGEVAKATADMNRKATEGTSRYVTAQDKATRAISASNAALGTMATKFGLVAAAAAPAIKAFTAFAESDKKLRQLGISADVSDAALKKLGNTIDQMAVDTRNSVEDTHAAIKVLRDGLGLTLEEAVKMFPQVAVQAHGFGASVTDAAKLVSGMVRNFKIAATDAPQAMEAISFSVRKLGLDAAELAPHADKIAATMESIGYSGVGGMSKTLALVASLKKEFGSTREAADALSGLTSRLAKEDIGEMLNFAPNAWANLMERSKKNGDLVATQLGNIAKSKNRDRIMSKLSVEDQKALNKLLEDNNGTIAKNIDLVAKAAQGRDGLNAGFKQMTGAQEEIDALSVSITNLTKSVGGLVSALGIPEVIGKFTEKISQLTEIVRTASLWMDYFQGKGERPSISMPQWHSPTLPSFGSVMRGMAGQAETDAGKKRLEEQTAPPVTLPGLKTPGIPLPQGYKRSSYGGSADSAYLPANFQSDPSSRGLVHRASYGDGGRPVSAYSPAGPQGYGGGTGYGRPSAVPSATPGGGTVPGVGAARGRVGKGGDPRGMEQHIRETARKYGIDPDTAVAVAKSEGLSTFQSSVKRSGKGSYQGREDSWGAFQLYMGGGLGNQFQKETGLDPRDPANEKATIDFALKHASKHGWGSWYGARNTGIGNRAGIPGGSPGVAPSANAAAPGGRYNYFQHRGDAPIRDASQLTTVKTGYGPAKIHPEAAEDFKKTSDALEAAGAPVGKWGSHNYRQKRWGGGWSSHAYGAALDVGDRADLSPEMKAWIRANPEKWKSALAAGNYGQPLTNADMTGGKDAPHIEWRGPRLKEAPSAVASPKPTQDMPPVQPTDDTPSTVQKDVNLNLRVNDNQVQFARSSMRKQADKEVREARWNSYSDIGCA